MKTTHKAECACTGQPLEIDIENGELTEMRVLRDDGVWVRTVRNFPPDVAQELLRQHEAMQPAVSS